jgi:Domain of unknown function (DUF4386)
MVEMACNITTSILFYVLLKPVNSALSLLAGSFSLVACMVKTMSRLFFLMPLFLLDASHSFQGFSREQVQSLALLLLKINAQGAAIAMSFFGFYAVLKGYLILNRRSCLARLV